MKNRFYKSEKVNELIPQLENDGFNSLKTAFNNSTGEALIIIDTKNKSFFVASEDLLSQIEINIKNAYDEILYDLDASDATKPNANKKQSDSFVEYESALSSGAKPDNMSLRDYFAAKAMQGELASQSEDCEWNNIEKDLAKRAYLIADEMLKAREL